MGPATKTAERCSSVDDYRAAGGPDGGAKAGGHSTVTVTAGGFSGGVWPASTSSCAAPSRAAMAVNMTAASWAFFGISRASQPSSCPELAGLLRAAVAATGLRYNRSSSSVSSERIAARSISRISGQAIAATSSMGLFTAASARTASGKQVLPFGGLPAGAGCVVDVACVGLAAGRIRAYPARYGTSNGRGVGLRRSGRGLGSREGPRATGIGRNHFGQPIRDIREH